MSGRGTLSLLLTVVAGAAAMLSFAALRDLALLCGFGPRLAWLLPVVVDAGAAAASLVWLAADSASEARRFARRLALGLLALSVAANALGHGLTAFALLPPWWVVVILSGIAPAVLGAMVHLAVLVGRPHESGSDFSPAMVDDPALTQWNEPAAVLDVHDSPPPKWDTPPPARHQLSDVWAPHHGSAGAEQDTVEQDAAEQDAAEQETAEKDPAGQDDQDRAAALIAAGAGRRRLSRELGVTEYEARRLLERTRPATTGTAPRDDSPTDDSRTDDAHATPGPVATTPTPTGARS